MSQDNWQPQEAVLEETSAPPQAGFFKRLSSKRALIAWALLTPMALGVIVFFIYPLIMTVYYSMTAYNMFQPPKWNDYANWQFLLTDVKVRKAATNTLWFVLVMVPARVISAMFVASVLTRARMASGVFRTLFYLPALIPPAASVIAFVQMLNPATGPVNAVLDKISLWLSAIGINIDLHLGWFTSPVWSKPALAFLGLWVVGDIMVIFLASLLDVPVEQYEAAELDGAGNISRFRFVTLPNMQPVILFAAVNGIIGSLQYFAEPAVAAALAQNKGTVGGQFAGFLGYPNQSTLTYAQYLYVQAFGYHKLGYASALAVLMFIVSAIAIFLLLRRFSEFSPEVAS